MRWKSLLSEFMQYDIREEDLEEMKEQAKEQGLLEMKLQDVSVLYEAFSGFLKEPVYDREEVRMSC